VTISRLEAVPLRELWRHEEHDFSAWLHDNIQVLGDALQMQLSEPKKEVSVGSFTVDLVAEEKTLGRVIIENQLAATDHDHLGKLLTYLTNLEAKTAVWITPQPRPEHARAVSWLNETTPDDVAFYLVQVAAYRIGKMFLSLYGVSVGRSKYLVQGVTEGARRATGVTPCRRPLDREG
jgi:hypothetical protein